MILANVEEIIEVKRLGVIDGVTTNPTHVAKTGRPYKELYREICDMVDGPVSLECVSMTANEIIDEARELAKFAGNAVVKIPLMREGLIAVKQLAAECIQTNVTVNFSAVQALLAAKCGATYISPFVGRLDAIGHDGMVLVQDIHTIYSNYGYKTEIIVAACRNPLHVLEAAKIGADICTVNFEILQLMFDHPLTDIGIRRFLKDWEKVPQ